MGTNEQTLDALDNVAEAIKILKNNLPVLARHVAQQRRQISWDNKGGYKKEYRYGGKKNAK